jgi:hypothetical protein
MGPLVSWKTTAITVAAKMTRREPGGCRRYCPGVTKVRDWPLQGPQGDLDDGDNEEKNINAS